MTKKPLGNLTEESLPDLPLRFVHMERDGLHLLLHSERPAWLVVNESGWEAIQSFDGKTRVKQIARKLSQKYEIDIPEALKDVKTYSDQLTKAGFLNGTPDSSFSKKEFKPAIKSLHLNITETCNLNCIHCGIMNSPSKFRERSLSRNTIFSVIDELSTYEGASISISGGEPLIHKNCMEVLNYAKERIPTNLTTNATLITKPVAETLAKLSVPLQISFDGAFAEYYNQVRGDGNFEKAISAINYLRELGMGKKLSLCVTLMRNNIERIFEIITFAEKSGIPNVRFLQIQRMGNAALKWNNLVPTVEQYKNFYERAYLNFEESTVTYSPGLQGFLLNIPNDRWCGVGNMLAIRSDGGIYPCTLMFHDEFLLGNIHSMTLKEAVESEKLALLKKQCSTRENIIKKCKHCNWKNFCQACCSGSLFHEKGSIMEVDDFCDVRKRLYENVIFRIAKNRNDPILKKIGEC